MANPFNMHSGTQPITSNNRLLGGCTGQCTTGTTGVNLLPFQQIFNLTGEIINVDALLSDLKELAIEIDSLYLKVMNWLDQIEYDFALKYYMGQLPDSRTLFNEVYAQLPKMKRARKVISNWYNEFSYILYDAYDIIYEYASATTNMRLIPFSGASISGLPDDNIRAAKMVIVKSGAMQKNLTASVKLSGELGIMISRLQKSALQMYSGRFDPGRGQIIDLREIGRTMNVLGKQSPMTTIADILAQRALSTPLNINLTSTGIPLVQRFPSTIEELELDGTITDTTLLTYLNSLKNTLFVTSTTIPKLDRFKDHIMQYMNSSNSYNQLLAIVEALRRDNTPEKMLSSLHQRFAAGLDLSVLIADIDAIIAKMSPNDLAVYQNELKNIQSAAEAQLLNNAAQV